jgi:ribonuclease P/MRP protein subunit RPP40
MNCGQLTGAVFLDLSKAFDLVNHDRLINKLAVYQLSAGTLAFITSYLNERTQYIHVNGRNSREGVIKHGVPQGSILGPLLFSVYINDLPLHISDPRVTCSLFADDGTLDVSSSDVSCITQSLQSSLADVTDWCLDNSMVPNPSKTTCMLITTRQKHQLNPPPLQLSFNGQSVEQVRNQRVLGIIIDDKLCWQSHIIKVCKTISKNLFLLSKLRFFTDESTRKLFYCAHIQPHLDYASSVWDGSSDANLKRLNSLHRRAIKLIVDRPRQAFSTDDKFKLLDILPLEKQFAYNKLVLMRKITLSDSPAYLTTLFRFTHRSSRTPGNNMVVPMPRLDIYKSSLSYSGAKLWNSVPTNIRAATSIRTFKSQLLKYISKTSIVKT